MRQCESRIIKHPTPAQMDQGNECIAYIEGFVDGKGPEYKFGCFVGFSFDQMAAVYRSYMQAHRDYLQMHKRLGLDAALTLKFCSYWKEPSVIK